MVFQNGTLGGLALAASVWMAAATSAAAAQPAPAMPLGSMAMPPEGYVAFCERQPWDCGAEPQMVLARAEQAEAERTALFAAANAVALNTLGVGQPAAALAPALASAQAGVSAALTRAPAPTMTASTTAGPASFAAAVAAPATASASERAAAPEPLRMTPQLWSKLNRVNDDVNRTIVPATDLNTYGKADYWSTPIEDGVRTGDCEDYVLEKQRALIAAGLPREVLNIAVVVTSWGESHAVLLVSTSEGDLVLDSLTSWIQPWQKTNYRWRQREVGGDAFKWVMVRDPSAKPPANLTVAALR